MKISIAVGCLVVFAVLIYYFFIRGPTLTEMKAEVYDLEE